MAKKKPIEIVVRRGALRRFDAMTRKTAELPVEVTWDRRTEQRRASGDTSDAERRSGDRRKEPPFTWQVADFVVVDDGKAPPGGGLEQPADEGIAPEQTEQGRRTANRE